MNSSKVEEDFFDVSYKNFQIQEYEQDASELCNVVEECNLLPFSQEIDLVGVMRNIQNYFKEPVWDWRFISHGLWDLRRLRKSFPDVFIAVFNNIFEEYLDCLSNNRSSIVRNSVRLAQEIFSHLPDCKDMPNWINHIVPKLYPLLISNRFETKKAFDALVDNCYYSETFGNLLEGCLNYHPFISNLSFDLIATKFSGQILNQNLWLKEELFNQFNWNKIMDIVVRLFETEKQMNKMRAFKVFKYLNDSVIELHGEYYWSDLLIGFCETDPELEYRLDKLVEACDQACQNYFNKIKYKISNNKSLIETDKKSKERNFWKKSEVIATESYRDKSSKFSPDFCNINEKFSNKKDNNYLSSKTDFGKENLNHYNLNSQIYKSQSCNNNN
jgi:hypothetical protein